MQVRRKSDKIKIMKRPYFIWDYDLSENQVRAILRGDNETEKLWLIGRIMTHAKFQDIFEYISIKEIVNLFPKLRLPQKIKQHWEYALNIWGYHV